MLIDLIYAVLLVFAIFKGIRRGFIIAIFSVLAFIIGLAAAMKLSTVVAHQLEGSTNISSKWLPFISFLIVFFTGGAAGAHRGQNDREIGGICAAGLGKQAAGRSFIYCIVYYYLQHTAVLRRSA